MATLRGDEPDLELGASGEHVVQLQDRLRGLGLLDKFPDGTYDDQTETAVRQLQDHLGQTNDGKVTQETWQALDQHMLDQGLQYNPYAGPGQQHWDLAAAPGDAGERADPAQAAQHWDGQQWLQWDAQAGQWQPMESDGRSPAAASADAAAESGSQDAVQQPEPHWDGQRWLNYDEQSQQWQPMQDGVQEASGPAAAAAAASPAPAADEPPVIPHIDNIHPAIRDDERFSSFHDFLRERHG